MAYKVVKRPHIVARGYLRGFARGEIIGMRLVGASASDDLPVGKVGVLKDFYRRQRPDGTAIYDIDASLDQIDAAAPPILREIDTRWPLTPQEKTILAEFIGMQLVRGPRWRARHTNFTSEYFQEVAVSGEFDGRQPDGIPIEDALEEAQSELSSDTETLTKMFEHYLLGAEVIGSMHWTLVHFNRPVLATSDHPVVLWPLDSRARRPAKSSDFIESGLLNTLEARFPVTSSSALLMTWADEPDDDAPIVRGSRETAANLNAFTIAEAEHQWFHFPGGNVPRASGRLLSLMPRLLSASRMERSRGSRRREITRRRLRPGLGKKRLTAGFSLTRINRADEMELIRVEPREPLSASGRESASGPRSSRPLI